jgi:hydrogenase maturation protein HypF
VKKRLSISIKGIVQGVGFRPFVYRVALKNNIAGWVSNNSAGVKIEAEASEKELRAFMRSIEADHPPLAYILDVSSRKVAPRGERSFAIKESLSEKEREALISPDVGLCDECLRELFDATDRRFRYPFINCTNCGPRYTITKDIPYDRINTTMEVFTMCAPCLKEYDDAEDRRFHAQPNACAACGPHIELVRRDGNNVSCSDPVAKAQALLKKGKVLAIKGLGGFHLAVDAENEEAVTRLRKRKNREEKPLAIMSADSKKISEYAYVSPAEQRLLESPERPIVILRKKENHAIAPAVSPTNKFFGVMLPYTPLHYLLLDGDFLALVMTSGNVSEEPIAFENARALERLGAIADFFLIHNRDIHVRNDDSVARVLDERPAVLRRARGYVPKPIFLKEPLRKILAVGPMIKNTVCLTKGNRAFVSQHIGDMENLETYQSFVAVIEHLKRILEIEPELVAHDLHPDYMSTRFALEMKDIRKVGVQHHHAHIASVLAENAIDETVIGVAFDGTGCGDDGTIWGGEFLIADCSHYVRVGHLRTALMPGGESAIKEPWRMAVSFLYAVYGNELRNLRIDFVRGMRKNDIAVLIEMIRREVRSPLTSSAGRLFEAVSALTGVCHKNSYEGQAAMELEGIAADDIDEAYPFEIRRESERLVTDWAGLVRGVVDDLTNGLDKEIISAKFHNTIAQMMFQTCKDLRATYGIKSVALSGGVFQNFYLLKKTREKLRRGGFTVYEHRLVPPNDGGISLGQAVIANARS